MPEMTAKEYLETKARMTKECGIACEDCPMSICGDDCLFVENEDQEKAIEIVRKWGEEHPKVTILDKLKEVFPDVVMSNDGTPLNMCTSLLGCKEHGCSGIDACKKCWNQPYKET